ncbi:MAG: phosphotransferase [Thalassovita sp.]
MEPLTDQELVAALCVKLWGKTPDTIEYPGGQSRKTIVVVVDGRRFVVSKRASKTRAKLEAMVLETLSPQGFVPDLIAHTGQFVVQQEITGRRLTEALELSSAPAREALLKQAGQSLLDLQVLGGKTDLLLSAPKIGDRPNWFRDFAAVPAQLAQQLGHAIPDYDAATVATKLQSTHPAFVKWDARAGNALYTEQDEVVWFDWEHCGVGAVEDDLVWLLADEWSPISPAAEAHLIDQAAAISPEPRHRIEERFLLKVVLHSMVRLGLIYARKADGPWWDARSAMANDNVGVSPAHVRRICRRARRWCDQIKDFHNVVTLLDTIERDADSSK